VIVYDTGALLAAERGARTMWAMHAAILGEDLSPLVPTGVLAQAWRGGPQANLSRLLAGCTVVPLDERHARASGTLCGRAGTADVVDAFVVVVAQLVDAAVVSSDPGDLRRLIEAAGVSVRIHEV
jgi:hypothetical protein